MTTSQDHLVGRVRAALTQEPSTREVPMFGARSFMVDEKILVAANRDGTLLVRIDPACSAELLALPGAEPAEMGAGRPMGPSWIRVAADALTTDADLSFWLDAARDYNARARKSKP